MVGIAAGFVRVSVLRRHRLRARLGSTLFDPGTSGVLAVSIGL